MTYKNYTTLKNRPVYYVFNLRSWIRHGGQAYLSSSGTILVPSAVRPRFLEQVDVVDYWGEREAFQTYPSVFPSILEYVESRKVQRSYAQWEEDQVREQARREQEPQSSTFSSGPATSDAGTVPSDKKSPPGRSALKGRDSATPPWRKNQRKVQVSQTVLVVQFGNGEKDETEEKKPKKKATKKKTKK